MEDEKPLLSYPREGQMSSFECSRGRQDWCTRKGSVVAGLGDHFSLPDDQIGPVPGKGMGKRSSICVSEKGSFVGLPTKRLSCRHENLASKNGWLSRMSPAACVVIRWCDNVLRRRSGFRIGVEFGKER